MPDYDPQRRRKRATPRAGNTEAVEALLGPVTTPANGNHPPASRRPAAEPEPEVATSAPADEQEPRARKQTQARPGADRPGPDGTGPTRRGPSDQGARAAQDPIAAGIAQLVDLASRAGCLGWLLRLLGRSGS